MPDAKPKNIYEKMLAVMAAIDKLEKSARNQAQGYDYVPYTEVARTVREHLLEQRILMLPSTLACDLTQVINAKGNPATQAKVQTQYLFVDVDNPAERVMVDWFGESIDYQDKATAQAGTSALKYALLKMFLIPDSSDPDAAEGHAPAAGAERPSATRTRPAAPAAAAAPAPAAAPARRRSAAPPADDTPITPPAPPAIRTRGQAATSEERPRKPDPIWEDDHMWCPLCDSELWPTPKDGQYGPYHSCKGFRDKGCKYSVNEDVYTRVKMQAGDAAAQAQPVGAGMTGDPADDVDPSELPW